MKTTTNRLGGTVKLSWRGARFVHSDVDAIELLAAQLVDAREG